MRWCMFCGDRVSDGVRGNNRLSPSLVKAFGHPRGTRMVIPVTESAMPDEEEHMAFRHGFNLESKRVVNGQVVGQGAWICVLDTESHAFGERWVRTGPRAGLRISELNDPDDGL